MEFLGRISQVIAFCVILISGCCLDSDNYMAFVYRILISVVWIIFVQALIDPVSIQVED